MTTVARDFENGPQSSAMMRRVVVACAAGAMLEFYDFFLYGLAAAVVFAPLFFSNVSPTAGTLASFATLGVGFVGRPIGGLIFGHFGDKLGRKSMLLVTVGLMGLSTFLIGLLPTYSAVGLWAPAALVVLRLLQGIAVGGEQGGTTLMTVECAPEGRRGFYGSIPLTASGVMGLALATGVFSLASLLPPEQFLSWGWRVPFLLSILLFVVGLYIRLKLPETPVFEKVKSAHAQARLPFIETLRRHPKSVLVTMGVRVCETCFSYLIIAFVVSYTVRKIGMSSTTVLLAIMTASILSIVAWPSFGLLSDYIGRKTVLRMGAIAVALYAFPFLWLISAGSVPLLFLAIIVGWTIIGGMLNAVEPVFFAEAFPASIRYTGVSIGFQVAAALGGGLAPFIATALVAWAGTWWPVAIYIILMAILSLVALHYADETFRRPLDEDVVTGISVAR